jgi:hypothetical protein
MAKGDQPLLSVVEDAVPMGLRERLWLCMRDIEGVAQDVNVSGKTKSGATYGFQGTSAAAILAAAKRVFVRHRVGFFASTEEYENRDRMARVQIRVTFFSPDTDEKIEGIWVGEGADGGDMGVRKAYTSAVKSCLRHSLGIVVGADEDESDGSEAGLDVAAIPPERLARTLYNAVGAWAGLTGADNEETWKDASSRYAEAVNEDIKTVCQAGDWSRIRQHLAFVDRAIGMGWGWDSFLEKPDRLVRDYLS